MYACCFVVVEWLGGAGKKCRGIVYAVGNERHARLPRDEKVRIHAHSLDFFDRPLHALKQKEEWVAIDVCVLRVLLCSGEIFYFGRRAHGMAISKPNALFHRVCWRGCVLVSLGDRQMMLPG